MTGRSVTNQSQHSLAEVMALKNRCNRLKDGVTSARKTFEFYLKCEKPLKDVKFDRSITQFKFAVEGLKECSAVVNAEIAALGPEKTHAIHCNIKNCVETCNKLAESVKVSDDVTNSGTALYSDLIAAYEAYCEGLMKRCESAEMELHNAVGTIRTFSATISYIRSYVFAVMRERAIWQLTGSRDMNADSYGKGPKATLLSPVRGAKKKDSAYKGTSSKTRVVTHTIVPSTMIGVNPANLPTMDPICLTGASRCDTNAGGSTREGYGQMQSTLQSDSFINRCQEILLGIKELVPSSIEAPCSIYNTSTQLVDRDRAIADGDGGQLLSRRNRSVMNSMLRGGGVGEMLAPEKYTSDKIDETSPFETRLSTGELHRVTSEENNDYSLISNSNAEKASYAVLPMSICRNNLNSPLCDFQFGTSMSQRLSASNFTNHNGTNNIPKDYSLKRSQILTDQSHLSTCNPELNTVGKKSVLRVGLGRTHRSDVNESSCKSFIQNPESRWKIPMPLVDTGASVEQQYVQDSLNIRMKDHEHTQWLIYGEHVGMGGLATVTPIGIRDPNRTTSPALPLPVVSLNSVTNVCHSMVTSSYGEKKWLQQGGDAARWVTPKEELMLLKLLLSSTGGGGDLALTEVIERILKENRTLKENIELKLNVSCSALREELRDMRDLITRFQYNEVNQIMTSFSSELYGRCSNSDIKFKFSNENIDANRADMSVTSVFGERLPNGNLSYMESPKQTIGSPQSLPVGTTQTNGDVSNKRNLSWLHLDSISELPDSKNKDNGDHTQGTTATSDGLDAHGVFGNGSNKLLRTTKGSSTCGELKETECLSESNGMPSRSHGTVYNASIQTPNERQSGNRITDINPGQSEYCDNGARLDTCDEAQQKDAISRGSAKSGTVSADQSQKLFNQYMTSSSRDTTDHLQSSGTSKVMVSGEDVSVINKGSGVSTSILSSVLEPQSMGQSSDNQSTTYCQNYHQMSNNNDVNTTGTKRQSGSITDINPGQSEYCDNGARLDTCDEAQQKDAISRGSAKSGTVSADQSQKLFNQYMTSSSRDTTDHLQSSGTSKVMVSGEDVSVINKGSGVSTSILSSVLEPQSMGQSSDNQSTTYCQNYHLSAKSTTGSDMSPAQHALGLIDMNNCVVCGLSITEDCDHNNTEENIDKSHRYNRKNENIKSFRIPTAPRNLAALPKTVVPMTEHNNISPDALHTNKTIHPHALPSFQSFSMKRGGYEGVSGKLEEALHITQRLLDKSARGSPLNSILSTSSQSHSHYSEHIGELMRKEEDTVKAKGSSMTILPHPPSNNNNNKRKDMNVDK